LVGRIRIDLNNDKADSPQPDDYMIALDWIQGSLMRSIVQGYGEKWTQARSDLPWVMAASKIIGR
jgi:hypothetical protein